MSFLNPWKSAITVISADLVQLLFALLLAMFIFLFDPTQIFQGIYFLVILTWTIPSAIMMKNYVSGGKSMNHYVRNFFYGFAFLAVLVFLNTSLRPGAPLTTLPLASTVILGTGISIFYVVFVSAVAPIAEERFWRHALPYQMNVWLKTLGAGQLSSFLTIFIISALFASVHVVVVGAGLGQLGFLFLFSIIALLVNQTTQSTGFGDGAHIGLNMFTLVLIQKAIGVG